MPPYTNNYCWQFQYSMDLCQIFISSEFEINLLNKKYHFIWLTQFHNIAEDINAHRWKIKGYVWCELIALVCLNVCARKSTHLNPSGAENIKQCGAVITGSSHPVFCGFSLWLILCLVPAITCPISWYIGRRYNGTRLYYGLIISLSWLLTS